jgi:hypothetical protein
MTVTIKDSNNNVVGTSESIYITTKDLSISCVSTKKDAQSNNISNLVRTPLYYDGEIILKFELINPVNLNTKADQKYTIYYTQTEEDSTQVIILKECKFNKDKCTCESIQVLYPDNIESVFKYHFPKLHIYRSFSDKVIVGFTESDLDTPSIEVNKFTEVYQSLLHLGNSDSIYLHQSTDLNELMQVTKQKLNDMFADWMSKVN